MKMHYFCNQCKLKLQHLVLNEWAMLYSLVIEPLHMVQKIVLLNWDAIRFGNPTKQVRNDNICIMAMDYVIPYDGTMSMELWLKQYLFICSTCIQL